MEDDNIIIIIIIIIIISIIISISISDHWSLNISYNAIDVLKITKNQLKRKKKINKKITKFE